MIGRLRRLSRSTTARLLLPLVLFQIVASGSVLGFAWFAGQQAVVREQRALVAELRDDLLADFAEGGLDQLRDTIHERMLQDGARAPLLSIVDARGAALIGNVARWPRLAAGRDGFLASDLVRSGNTAAVPAVLSISGLHGGYRLLAGREIEDDLRLRRSYEQALFAALLFAIPLAALVALVVARLVGTRLRSLAHTAHQVSAGALEARVPLDGSGDGFDRLGAQMNTMLDRIETLVGELRVVTDGLAHDLRSPLTRLRSSIERAVAEAGDCPAAPQLDRALAEADAVLTMLSTALQISRAEAGIGRDRFVDTDLRQLLDDVAEIYGPVVEESGVALEVEGEPGLLQPINRELVAQALGNLIDNSLKYADGSRIVLSASHLGDGVRLEVRDDGAGIPESRRDEARQRFARLDPARSIAGSGLGLALVEAVARLHGGTIALSDAAPGLNVALLLPTARR